MSNNNDCMFCIPPELSGRGLKLCGLFNSGLPCNQLGDKCNGYKPHTRESRAVMDRVLKEKKEVKE